MLSPIKLNLSQKLKDKSYRDKFFRGQAEDEIAGALLSARKKRGLTQAKLEKLSGMKQSAISRIEQASYAKWNFTTLLRLANALNVRVRVHFDYAEDVIRDYECCERANETPGDQQDLAGASSDVRTKKVPGDQNDQSVWTEDDSGQGLPF